MIPLLIEPDAPWLDVISHLMNTSLRTHPASEIDSHVWAVFIKVNHSPGRFHISEIGIP